MAKKARSRNTKPDGLDRIEIAGIPARAIIGATKRERTRKQTLIVALTLELDARNAARSDRLERAVDYERVTARIRRVVKDSRFHLLEALAEACARAILSEFPVARASVRIDKPGALRHAAGVSVTITRRRA